MTNVIGRCNRVLLLAGCGVLALCLPGCVAMGVRQLHWNGLRTGEVLSAFNFSPKA